MPSPDAAAFVTAAEMLAVPYPAIIDAAPFRAGFAGRYQAEPRQVVALDHGRSRLIMRASAPDGTRCTKTLLVDPNPPPDGKSVTATYVLETDAGSVAMDGTALTEIRTAACALFAARCAIRQPRNALILGTGALAPEFLRAYAEGLPSLQDLALWGRDGEKTRALAGDRARAVPPEALREAVAQADVIATLTAATTPLIGADYVIKPGAHIGMIGSWQPSQCEVAGAKLRGAQVFVDVPQAVDQAGELIAARRLGAIGDADIQPAAALMTVAVRGTSFYKSVGNAAMDLALGQVLLALLRPGVG